MGNLRHWCLAGLLGYVFLTVPVFAETTNATPSAVSVPRGSGTCTVYAPNAAAGSTQPDVASCKTYLTTKINSQMSGYTCGGNPATFTWVTALYKSGSTASGEDWRGTIKRCWETSNQTVTASFSAACPTGSTYDSARGECRTTQYSCPDSSWTLSGTTCTRTDCPAGEFRDPTQGNTCHKDCSAKAGQATPNTNYLVSNKTGTLNGCQIRCSTSVTALQVCIGGSCSYGSDGSSCTYTGKTDQPGDYDSNGTGMNPNPNKSPASPRDCTGSGMGYVTSSSGNTTCVAAETAPDGQKPMKTETESKKETGSDTNGDGKPDTNAPDYKATDTTTSKSGNQTTTITKETTNATTGADGSKTCPSGATLNADGVTCTKTTSSTQDNSTFCKENPTDQLCKGAEKSTFGGSCMEGFSCTGDAAQCASAKAAYELKCAMTDTSGSLIDANTAGGTPEQIGKGDAALNSDGSKDFNIANEFTSKQQAWVNFSSGCPIGIQTFSILGKEVKLDGSAVCEIGKFLRLLIHMMAYMGLVRLFAFKLV